MFRALQSFRFLFAVMIFFHHMELFEAGGSCGVSFFLVLSGFVMAKGYGEKVAEPEFSYVRYLKRRLLRIYPLHLVCLLLAVAVLYFLYDTDVWGLWWWPNLALLQSWIPLHGVYFSGNAVSWCLSDLLFFYALFPLLYRRMRRVPLFFRGGGLWTLLFVAGYVVAMVLLPESYGNAFFYIFPLFRLPDFLLGIWGYRLYEAVANEGQTARRLGKTSVSALEILAVVGVAATCMLYYHVPENASYAFVFWLPVLFFILVFALSSQYGGKVGGFFSSALWVRLGNVSFTFYMVHQLCILAGEAYMQEYAPSVALWVRIPLYFFFSLAAAFLLYYGVEKPLARLWLSSNKA